MHIDLTFWEAVQFAALIMGGMFALLKFASYQFMRNITHAIAEMQKVIAGTRTMPTVTDAIAELPKFTWP